jgi:hypothetical protein
MSVIIHFQWKMPLWFQWNSSYKNINLCPKTTKIMKASLSNVRTHFKSVKCFRWLHRFSFSSGHPHLLKGRRVQVAAYPAGLSHHECQSWKVKTVVLKWVFMEGQNAKCWDSWTSSSYTVCAFMCVCVCVYVCLYVWCDVFSDFKWTF